MKKKTIIILVIVLVLFVSAIFGAKALKKAYYDYRIKNAKIVVELKDDLNVAFLESVKVSDLITNINGDIVDDYTIDTTKLGEREVKFKYINEEDLKIPYSYKINVVDKVSPTVWLSGSYSVTTSFNSTLEEKILCADDYDDELVCRVEGDYNFKTPGSYSLKFVAEDSSGNKTEVPFTLRVTEPKSGGSNNSSGVANRYEFRDAKNDLGQDGAKFGIDVSAWQGEIDYDKVKNAGVEFAFVRVGSTKGMDGDFFVDSKFDRNMEGFNRVGIPVGAYFYSYAKDANEAKEEAEWVVEHLKKYKVDLPIVFDFEDWGRYNRYKMSLYRLNRNAEVFIETLEKAGYEGALYGSLNYLNKLWNTEGKTVWVAHYTKNANYKDKFKFWQFSANGRVDGIPEAVDMDIMYE